MSQIANGCYGVYKKLLEIFWPSFQDFFELLNHFLSKCDGSLRILAKFPRNYFCQVIFRPRFRFEKTGFFTVKVCFINRYLLRLALSRIVEWPRLAPFIAFSISRCKFKRLFTAEFVVKPPRC